MMKPQIGTSVLLMIYLRYLTAVLARLSQYDINYLKIELIEIN